MTIPACLPITTDYFPDKRALQIDYVISLYNLLPDDVNIEFAQQRAIYKKPLTTNEVFKELISQRLAQGFQLVLLNESEQRFSNGSLLRKRATEEKSESYILSIGRLFHKISLAGNAITVTRYRPRYLQFILFRLRIADTSSYNILSNFYVLDTPILASITNTGTDSTHLIMTLMKNLTHRSPRKNWSILTGIIWIITFALEGIPSLFWWTL